MKVIVTGATGFTGSYAVPLLLEQGYHVRCLVRPDSNMSRLQHHQVELVQGDLSDHESLVRAFLGMDALVNIASLGFGHAPTIVKAAETAGLKRAIFISTTAIFTGLNAPSKVMRTAAEETIRQSTLPYTILRPTMIYGSSRDRNMCRLIRYLHRRRLIPIFGNGQYLQQPVYVGDVATAIVQALATEQATRQAYNVSGASVMTYDQVIDTVCKLLRRNVRKVHLPVSPIVAGLNLIERLPLRVPLKAEQILRLNEHKTFSFDDAARDFGYKPRSFTDGVRLELQEMGLV